VDFTDLQKDMSFAKCGDCGNDCQVPFKPKEDRPVYCRECFQNHKPEPRQGGGRFGGNRDGGRFGGNRDGGRFGRRDDRPREMFKMRRLWKWLSSPIQTKRR